MSLLCGFGSAVGRGPHYVVNGGKHYANLYACLVGLSSAGKGQAWDAAKYMLRFADTAWLKECVCLGLSSGEGLVKRVRDAETEQQPVKDEEGNLAGFEQVIVEAGAKDKRLLCLETEFQRLLSVSRREGNTLSAILRSLWDFGAAEVLTKNPLRATDAHVNILAHVTKEELNDVLVSRVEMVNGFANRFLWCHVQEMPDLADGGNFAVLDRFAEPLASALAKAKIIGEMRRTEDAAVLWRERYGELRRAGNRVRACERARPQTLRLSMLYALADGSAEVGLAHLRAGLAVWDYCEASAKYLFQHDNKPTPSTVDTEERLWEKLLEAIYKAQNGISKSDLLRAFREPVAKVDKELAYLETNRLAHRRMAKTGGRDAEVWFPGPDSEPPDDGKEGKNCPAEASDDGGKEWKEGKNGDEADTEATSFLPSQAQTEPTPEQSEASGQDGSEEGGVVVMPEQNQAHFTFEPSGGFGMASGEGKAPSPLEPFQVLYHGSSEVRRVSYNADSPPASDEEKQAWLEAVRNDDFLARLDEEPDADEALDGAEFQRRLEAAAEASLTA